MRVLFINPLGTLGGAERSMLDIFAALRQMPHVELRLMTLGEGPLLEAARALDVEAELLPLPAPLVSLGESGTSGELLENLMRLLLGGPRLAGFARDFRRRLAALSPEIVHTNGVKAHCLALGLCPPRLPLVVHVRDYLSERPLSRHALKLLRLRHGMIITNSDSVHGDARALLPGFPVRTLLNAVDTDHFAPGPSLADELATRAGMEPPTPDTVCLGLIATYARWKGHDLALRALARLRTLEPSTKVRLYIAGGPIYQTSGSQFSEAELRALARSLGIERDVGFLGFQDDVAWVYRSVDIVVHASTRREAFGRTIAEAMASGRAVVVARAGGALELFREGETALGFEAGDPAALAAALARLARDPELRSRLGDAARKHAVQSFGRQRLAPALERIYEDVLAKGPP